MNDTDRDRHDAGRNVRLLIVDDDIGMCELALDLAEGLGMTAGIATDQAGFLAGYRRLDPMVVLLDLQMPDADGVELLNELYRLQSRAQIILMSGFDRRVLKSARDFGLSRGLSIAAAIEKPFTIPEMEDLLLTVAAKTSTPQHLMAGAASELSASDLAVAIAENGLFLRYQPKLTLGYDGACDRIGGVEALVRWQHAAFGEVQPGRFIVMAERSGLIGGLTDFVFRAAATQAAHWAAAGCPLHVAVNLSPVLLNDPRLPDRLATLAHDCGASPKALTIEVTENAVMRDVVAATEVLTRFRLNGFGLSIDDFGTGHSSLVELYRMPFNELKIDRTFVGQVTQQKEAQVIVRTLVRLSHDLGLRACAEGAEDPETIDFLRLAGCDELQGYGLSRPLLADQIAGFVGARGTVPD